MSDIIEVKKRQKDVIGRLRRSKYIGDAHTNYSIMLLLDSSASMAGMRGKKIEDAKEALVQFIGSINITENEVGLVAFGRGIHTCGLSRNSTHLKEEIKRLEPADGTPMMSAIEAAYKEFLREKVHTVMVIATDGKPMDATEEKILEYASSIKTKGVRVITIGIGEDVNKSFLSKLASSPSDYHFAKASFELKRIYKEVADVLALPSGEKNYLEGK
jgi:Mg-chelatase subunit ChlD